MARYMVTLTTEASFSVEVEARTEEDALDIAFDKAPYSLCHAEPVEIGDWGLYEDNPALHKQGLRSARLIEENN